MKIRIIYTWIMLVIASGCGSRQHEATETADTIGTSSLESSVEAETDEENINDEDHGDPGLEGLLIDSVSIDPEVKTFLAVLTRSTLGQTLPEQQDILILVPRPGISPQYTFANSLEKLFEVDELLLYLSDSSALRPAVTYRRVWDACHVIEEMPEGIYLSDIDFKDLSFSDGDGSVNEKLKDFMMNRQADSGTDILIKFRTKTDDMSFLRLLTVKRNGKLTLAIIDQRDCGA